MSRALASLALLLALAAPLGAQDDAIDADYRVHDTVVIDGFAEPLVGTILEGRDPSASRLKIRTVQGVVTEVGRDKVRSIVDRETPESAFKARAARLKDKGRPAEHRLLGEWALKQGLLEAAEAEVALAAEGEPDPARALGHRERLVDLLERRLPEQTAEGRDAIHEKILRQAARAEAAGAASPRLALARARVALALELPEVARGALAKARAGLEARLGGGPAPSTEAPGPGTEAPAPGTEAPPRRGPRFGRDGVGLDPDPKAPPAPPPAAPEPAEDRSDVELAGLDGPERDAWREALLLDADAALRLGQVEDAQATWERLLEVWPQERRACLGLARLLVARGGRGPALDLLGAALRVFPRDAELLLVRGQVRTLGQDLDGALADLELALAAAGAAAGGATPGARPAPGADALTRDVRTALGLAHLVAGRFAAAKPLLEAADAEPGHGPARLARALLAECQGDAAAARTHYEEAARLLAPRGGEARYGLSFVRAEAGDAQGAQAALREALREGLDPELTLRALEDLAVRRGDAAAEARLLEVHLRASDDPSPDLLARLGRAWLAAERFDEARALFERGLAEAPDHLGCLRGVAWDAYRRDDRDRAKALLERLAALDAQDAWARRALKNLEDARTRRVWTDGFDRPGTEVKNSWEVEARFGLEVKLADGHLYVVGRQANEAGGKTRVARRVTGEQVAKLEARLCLDRLGDQARAGVRLESPKGGAAVLFRDADGRVKAALQRTAQTGFEDPVDLGDWPGQGTHALAIEVEDAKAGAVALWVDGQRRGEVKVPGLAGDVEVSVYAQGNALGAQVEVSVDDVRVFVVRDAQSGARPGGGY